MFNLLTQHLDFTNNINFALISFTIVFGLIFGSFSTFVGFRLFNDEVVITGKRSVCCKCKHKLGFFDLIPFFSFIFLKGRCRYCREKIPLWHFLAEVFMPICFVLSVCLFNGLNLQSILLCIISWCLITQSIIDARVMLSSDLLHIVTILSTFTLSRLMGNSVKDITIMIVAVALLFFLLSQVMKIILKKDCLGFGDVKLFISLSVLFTFEQFTIFLGLTGFFGIIFYVLRYFYDKKHKINVENKNEFPFIPSISVAFLFVFYICLFKLW